MPDEPPSSPLDALPMKDGFRLRGLEVTRLETFTDAAFAFAVTLLVVSIDAIPDDYDKLLLAMKGIPAFATTPTPGARPWRSTRSSSSTPGWRWSPGSCWPAAAPSRSRSPS